MKNLYWVVALSFLTFVLFSCNKANKNVDNEIAFDTIHVAKIGYVDNDSSQFSCNLTIDFIYPLEFKDTAVLRNLQKEFKQIYFEDADYSSYSPKEAIDKFVVDYVEQYKAEIKSYKENLPLQDDTEAYLSHYERIEGHVLFNKDGLLSFQLVHMINKGDITYNSFSNYVFDLKTGKILKEEDIFNPDYESALRPVFIKKITEANNVSKPEDLAELGFLELTEIAPNKNFYVDDKGITYIFNKGEYSALKLDEIRVFLPYKEILPILKKDSPLSILIQD